MGDEAFVSGLREQQSVERSLPSPFREVLGEGCQFPESTGRILVDVGADILQLAIDVGRRYGHRQKQEEE